MLSHFTVLGISVNTYWLAVFCGMVGMCIMNIKRRRMIEISKAFAVILGVYMTLCGIIGAKLLYIAENFSDTLQNGITLNGVSFFGMVFFLPLALLPMARLAKCRAAELIDFCTPPVLLMLAFIRIGCFLSGCCGGIGFDIFGLHAAFPTQLIECCADLAIMYFLLKTPVEKHGMLYPSFMVMYGSARFLIEFMRVREVCFLAMSHGHFFALVSIAAGAYAYMRIKRKG